MAEDLPRAKDGFTTAPSLLAQAKEFVEPLTRRSVYRRSRLAILNDGTTMPVLELLAREKFMKWEEDQFPFWVDGDYHHEVPENVGLATRSSNGETRQRSSLGVPAGTKEYMKRWRERNKERVQASQRQYAAKRREVLSRVQSVAHTDPVLEKLLKAVNGKD